MPEPPADWKPYLGRKISLRFALRGDPEHPFSEAIGVLKSVSEGDSGAQSLQIITRRGDTVTVAASDVLAAKIFPV
ncbi:MAG: hypothetical protein ACRDJJ_08465 [Actinomycetota bacterium]